MLIVNSAKIHKHLFLFFLTTGLSYDIMQDVSSKMPVSVKETRV